METSHNTPTDPQPDWARLLPREAFHQIILTLRSALPPPLTDDPADEMRRDRAAMAAVASLLPENAAEGRLAAQFVAADAWAMDCLRLAGERRREPEIARKCRAQALSMMREAKSAWRLLLKAQAERRAIEADEAAANRAAWIEHGVTAMMSEGLTDGPAAAPEARRDHPAPSGTAPARAPARAPEGEDGRHMASQDGERVGRPEPLAAGIGAVSRSGIGLREARSETGARLRAPPARAA